MKEKNKDLMIAFCSGALLMVGTILIHITLDEGNEWYYIVPGIIFFIIGIYNIYRILE